MAYCIMQMANMDIGSKCHGSLVTTLNPTSETTLFVYSIVNICLIVYLQPTQRNKKRSNKSYNRKERT